VKLMADQDGGLSAVESLLGDRYTREARLAPAFLSVFPILLVLIAFFPGLRSAVPALLALFCVFGVVRWISHIARGIGDRREKDLYRRWGGKPTTTMLRFAARRTDAHGVPRLSEVEYLLQEAPLLKDIEPMLHKRGGPRFPTQAEDDCAVEEGKKNAGKGARHLDSLYEPVVAWMRENSRGNKLVFEENISYGFQRNFYALKGFAIACGVVALIAQGIAVFAAWHKIWLHHASRAVSGTVLVAIVAYIIGVCLFVSEDSVMIQGFTYARQLLDSLYRGPSATQPDKGKDGHGESS
jgi:hypothetical protein